MDPMNQGHGRREQSSMAGAPGQDVADAASRLAMAMTEVGLEAWNIASGLLFWGQDQTERTIRVWLEQGRIGREQAQLLQNSMMEQIRRNQAEMQRMISIATQGGVLNAQAIPVGALEGMERQIAMLSAQVEALRQAQAQVQAQMGSPTDDERQS